MSPRYKIEMQRISLDKRMAAYTLAGVAVLAAPTVAKASSITYVPNIDQTFSQPGSYTFNPGGITGTDITITANAVSSDFFGNPANEIDAAAGAHAGLLGFIGANALSAGQLINPNASCGIFSCWTGGGKLAGYDLATNSSYGGWPANGDSSYLGFYFDAGSGKQAGWAQIATTADAAGSSFEILSYAYENDPNTAILAGQTVPTPEPGTMTLLGLGGAGLAALRRRRGQHA